MHKGLACVGAYKWHSSGRWGGCNYSHSCKVCAFLKILQMQHGDKGQLELPHPKLPFWIHVKKWPDSNYVQRQYTWGNRRERPPHPQLAKKIHTETPWWSNKGAGNQLTHSLDPVSSTRLRSITSLFSADMSLFKKLTTLAVAVHQLLLFVGIFCCCCSSLICCILHSVGHIWVQQTLQRGKRSGCSKKWVRAFPLWLGGNEPD